MVTKPKTTPIQREKAKLKGLKEMLAEEIVFLKKQRNSPFMLVDQQEALDAQIAILEIYL